MKKFGILLMLVIASLAFLVNAAPTVITPPDHGGGYTIDLCTQSNDLTFVATYPADVVYVYEMRGDTMTVKTEVDSLYSIGVSLQAEGLYNFKYPSFTSSYIYTSSTLEATETRPCNIALEKFPLRC